MNIVFRADASPEIGYGHLSRCLNLAQAFVDQNSPVTLITHVSDKELNMFPAQEVEVVAPTSKRGAYPNGDLLIYDRYQTDFDEITGMHEKFPRIVIFDDGDSPVLHNVNGVINPSIDGNRARDRYPEQIKLFAGPEYFIVANEFINTTRSSSPEHIFLSMGGSDPLGQVPRVLPLLLKTSNRPIDAVIGSETVESLNLSRYESNEQVTFYSDVSNMADIMKDAHVAITGAGTMLVELAAMGVPTASLVLTDNQQNIANRFHQHEATFVMGRFNSLSDEELAEAIDSFLTGHNELRQYSEKAQALVDGRGKYRLTNEITEWVNQS